MLIMSLFVVFNRREYQLRRNGQGYKKGFFGALFLIREDTFPRTISVDFFLYHWLELGHMPKPRLITDEEWDY